MELQLLLVVALVASTQAGPIDTIRDSCSRTCTNTNKFGYRTGKSYEFDYNVKTSTSVKGASEGSSQMELTATVHVEAVSKCDFILRIEDVRLHETDPMNYDSKILSAGSEELRSMLERHDLRFSFQDGIVDELCPSSDEVTWALNIKRGILSVFQNSMDDLRRDQKTTESDVNGNCEVEYSAVNNQDGYTVRRTKHLLGCTERNDYSTSVQGIPYRVPSDNQAIPVINSEHHCQQEISSEGLLTAASCMESHTFRPFSREGSGAVTESKQTLNFVRESIPSSTPGAIIDRRGMTFEHAYDADKSIRSQVELEVKLMEVCENTRHDVRPETPRLFTELVYLMKTVDSQSLRRVYQKLGSASLCPNNIYRVRKFFMDAIPMAGTSASLNMLTELINSEEVTGVEADMWLTTLSFIQHPTKDMLREVTPLLSKNNGKAMLAVTSLVHNFCRKRSCDNDMDVLNIISTIEGKIEYGCNVDGDKLQKTILSLRALGNAGHAISAVSTINSCLSRTETPTEVRLAAIEAFRRMPCEADKSEVQTVFANGEEDSEIRIAAYLALMQCPNAPTIALVKQQLESEDVNQVGSFIWSHLSNLKETSNIHKQDIRALLRNEELRSNFDLDNRKFSHNYEKSIFLEKLNAGASVESNLIWSSSSFLPRSMMANLTVDLFGNSVNLFEVGGRIEGLEYFLESYFGPNGYFSDNEAADVNQQNVKGISSRKMRNIDNEFGTAMDELKGTLYTRVFGNELGYARFDGKQSLLGEDFNILEMLISLSNNHDYTLTQNFMFMDSSMIIPTSSGFPLNLTVNGTATVDMKLSGKMDLRKVATSPRSVVIRGAIQPSAALEVSSMMSVDAFVTKSGMKMVSTLHTSTAIQGKVELADGRVLEMELDMPREKMEILNFKTAFFTVHKDHHSEQEMITENKQFHKVCTGDAATKVTGLQLCGEVHFPNASLKADAPYFPLTGPVKMAVDLTKKDTLTSYRFETKLANTKQSVAAKVAFDTPGSTVDRNMGMDFLLNNVDNSVQMNLVSPWMKASASGSLTNERALKRLEGQVMIDTKKEYLVNAEVRQSRKGSAYVYTPSFTVTVPGKDNINLGGSITYLPSKSIEGDVTLTGIRAQPVKGRFSIQNKKTIRSLMGGISFTKGKEYSAIARIQISGTAKAIKYRPNLSVRTPEKEVVAFGGTAEYRRGKSAAVDLTLSKIVSKDIKLFVKIRNLGNKKTMRYQTKVDVRTPFITTKVQSNVVLRGGKALITRATIDYVIPRVIRDKITVNGKANLAMTKALTRVKGTINAAFKKRPQYNIGANVDASHTRKTTGLKFNMVYGANQKDKNKSIALSSTVRHQRVTWPQSTLAVNFDLKHLGMGIDIGFQGRHTHDRKQLETTATFLPGKDNEVSTTLRLRNKSKATKDLSGTLAFSYGGENIEVSNDLNEGTDGEFTNTLTAQWAKSKRNTIVTTFRLPSSRELIGSVDVNLADMRRVRIAGRYFFTLRNMSAATEVRLARDKYALSSSYQVTDGKAIVATDVEYPSRHITFEADVKRKSPRYTVRTNLLWDADNDITKRFQLDGQATVEDINTIDVNVNNKSPLGVFTVNLKHRGGNKYTTHADVEWGQSKRISVDTTLSNKRNQNYDGILQITTPFSGYRSIAIEAAHISDSSQYSSSLDIDWKPVKKISTTVTLKKPISLTNFEGEVSIKSPVKGFQRTTLGINHKFTDKLTSMAKFTWNKNLVQFNVDGANKGTPLTRDVTGRVSLKTTLPSVGSMYIGGRHSDDGRRFANNFHINKDGQGITYEGEMTHDRSGWQVQNSGRFSLTALSHSIQSTWNHENTPSTIRSNVSGNYGDYNIEFDLNTDHDLAIERGTGSLSMQLRGNVLPTVGISATHEHARGLINNVVAIQHNDEVMISIKNKYERNNGHATSVHTMGVLNNVYNARLDVQYNDYPYSGTVHLEWAPTKTITFSGILDQADGLFSGSMSLQSPVMTNIDITFNQNKQAMELINTVSLQYGSTQVFSIENRLRMDNNKRIFLLVTSELEDIRRLETNLEFNGNMDAFQTAAYFELNPLVSRMSVSSQWNMQGDVIGNIRIETPFAVLPYSQVTITSKLREAVRTSVLNIEYLPRRVLKVESSQKYLPEDIFGSVVLTTPFNQIPRVAATAKLTGNSRRFRSSIALEDIHGQKYEAKTRFGYGRRLTGELSLKAPHINDIVAMINHESNSRQLTSHGQLTWLNGNRYQAIAEFTREGKLEGKIILKSPHFEDITVTAHQSGNVQSFKSNAGLTYGGEISELEIVFVNDVNVQGTAILRSPYTGEMSALVQHNGNMENFESHAEVQYQTQKQFEVDATFRNNENTEGMLKAKSPMFNTITVLFNKNGQWKNFQGHVEVQYQTSNKIEIDTTFNIINKIEGSFRLQTPYTEDLSAAVHHSGNLQQFQCHAELIYHPTKKIEGDVSFTNGERTEGSVAIKTPFCEDISAWFQHEKQSVRFNTHGEVQYGTEKVQGDVSVGWGKKMMGSFALKTPFTDDMHASFQHSGNVKQFSSHAELSLSPKDKKYEADITFAKARKIKASASIKSKHFKDLNLAFSNRGRLVKFNNKMSVQYGKDKLDTDLTFSVKPSISTRVVVNTPFKGFRKMQASVKHVGSWKAFNTKATAAVGKSKIIASSRFTLSPLSADINVQTPFAGYQQLGASISHAGTYSRFQSRAEITYGKQMSIVGDMQFNAQPLTALVTVTTPFTGYETFKAELSHKGNKHIYQSNINIDLPRKQKLSATANVDLKSDISADLTITTPFKGYQKITAALSHTGTLPNFACHAEAGTGARKIVGDVHFSIIDMVSGEATLKTPFRGFKKTQAAFSIDGPTNDFRTHAEVTAMKAKHEVDLTFSVTGNIAGNLVIKSPYVKTIKATISHSGNNRGMTSEGKFVYGGTEVVSGQMNYNSAPSITGTATVKSMWTSPAIITFSHSGDLQNFNSQVDAAYADAHVIVESTLDTRRDISGSLNLRSPFYPIEDLRTTLSHTGSFPNGRYQIGGSYKGEEVETVIIVDSESKKEVSVDITTPFNEYRHMKAAISHTYAQEMVTGSVELELNEDKIECQAVLNMKNGLIGRFIVKSPWHNDVIGEFSHTGPVSAFVTHAELTYSGMRNFQADITFENEPRTTLTASIVTPLGQVRNIGATVRHQGTLEEFSSFMEFSLNDRRIGGDVTFSSLNGIDARTTIRTPYTKDIKMVVTQSGTIMNMQSHAELTYGRVKEIEFDASWDFISSIDGTITVKTPVESFDNMSFRISHVGGVNGFRSSATATYHTNQKIEIAAVFKNGATQEASVVFTSPFTSDLRASFLKGDEEATGEVYYNESEKMYTRITYSTIPVTEGSFLFRSVILGMETLNGALRHEVSMQTKTTHIEFAINGQTTQVDISFKNGFKTQGSLRIRTPITAFDDFNIAFSHKQGKSILESAVQVNYGEQQSSAEVSLRWRNNIDGSFRITTPFRNFRNIRGSFAHSGNRQQFTSHADFQYAPSKKLSGDITFSSANVFEGSVSINTPMVGHETMTAAFRHDCSTENLSSHLEISYQPNKKFELDMAGSLGDSSNGQVTIKTPFAGYEETTGMFSQNLRPNGYEARLEAVYNHGQRLEVDLNASPNEGRFVLRTPFSGFEEISTAFNKQTTPDSMSGHVEATYQGQKMEVDVTLSSSNGKVTIKTPFSGYEEMSASFTLSRTADNFVSHVEMFYLQQQKFSVDFKFSKRNGRFLMTTPFAGYEQVSASFTNAITGAEISSTTEVTYSTGKKIETEFTFSPESGRFTVKTPFSGYEEMTVAFTQQLTNTRFTGMVEVSPEVAAKFEISVDLSYNSGHLTVKTPMEGYELMSTAFTNRFSGERFTHQSELTYLPGHKFELDVTLSSVEGHAALRTPFLGYEEISAAFTNQMTDESITTHAEVTYLSGRKIQVDFALSSGNGHVTIMTPFRGYEEMSAAFTHQMTDRSITTHAEVTYLPERKIQIDVSLSPENGQITIRMPFNRFDDISASFTNRINGQSIINHIEIHYEPGIQIESDISISPREGSIVLRTPFRGFEVLSTAYRQEITEGSISGSFEVSLKQGEKFEVDISISTIAGHITVKTPYQGYRLVSTSFTTEVSSDSASTKFALSYNPGEKFEADITLSLRKGHFIAKTPISGYETFSAAYTLEIGRTTFALHTEATAPNSNKIEVDVSANFGGHVKANVDVKTPFTGYEQISLTISHVMQRGNMQSSASIDYGKKIAVTATITTRGGLTSSLTVKTPYKGYRLSKINFDFTRNDRAISSRSAVEFDGQKTEYVLSVSYNPSIDATFVLKTPFRGLETTSVAFQHVSSEENQQINTYVIYSNQKKIQFDMTLQTGNAVVGNISLNTPFTGFESSTASFEITTSESAFTSNVVAAVGDRSIRNAISFAMTDNSITGSINLQTPFEHFENMDLRLNAAGSWADNQIDMTLTYHETKPLELLLKHTISGDRYDASFLFRTLYTPELTASLTHNGNWQSFSNELHMRAGTDYDLQHVTTCRLEENSADMSSTFTGILNGRRHLVKSTFNHHGQVNNFRTNLMNNVNGRKSVLNVSFRNAASIDGSFSLKSPFKMIKNIAGTLQHSGDLDQFSTIANVQLTPTKVIAAKVDFFKHRLRRINADIELATPFAGLKLTKVTYRHTVTSNDIKCFSDITYGADKVSGSLKASKSPLSFDVSLQTPFTNFEQVGAKAKYARQGLSYTINMNVKYCTGKEITFKSSVDLAANPITLTADLTTPFAGYELTELRYTHTGRFPDFRCTADFSASYSSPINGELAVRFGSISDMQMLVTFTSPFFENADTLRFALRNQKDTHEYQSHTEVAWTQTDVIAVDGTFANSETWNGNTGNIGLTISTPFSSLRSGVLILHHDLVSSKYTEAVSAEWNGEKMLDMDVVFGKDTSYVAALTMRAPRPIAFSSNGEITDAVIRGDVNMNWNTESRDSNVRMTAVLNDGSDRLTKRKDMSMTVTLPRKSVTVSGSLSKSSVALSSSGNVIVDGVTKFGIDYETSAKTKRNHKQRSNTLAIRLPSRTLKTTSLFSDTYGTKTSESAILWDAERDETKKIGVRGSLIPQGRSTKADISISFPSIGKNVKLDSEVTMNSGNIIFDGKTEFSYSGDANKNFVVHSRVEDLSSGFRKNYTFVVGVTHPATTIDVQLTSHLGHMDNKYSANVGLEYLTASRNRKNFALMGEIDSMRKQMKVEMVSPVKSIKVSGQVSTSVPYRLSIHNQYDVRPVDAELIIDPSKLNMGFHMNYDIDSQAKVIHVEAKYVNNSAIRAEIYREENTQRITDTLFAMRLNSSTLLHTRLHWRPTIVRDLKTYGLRHMARNNRDLVELYNEIASGVNEEMNSKYNNIRSAILEELKTFVKFAATNIRSIQEDVASLAGTVDCAEIDSRTEECSQYLTATLLEFQNLARWMGTEASTRVPYPMKDTVDMYIAGGSEMLKTMGQESMKNYAAMMTVLDEKLRDLSTTALQAFKDYHDHLTNAIAQPLNTDTVRLAKAKYNEYLTKLTSQLPSINDMAQRYTSSMYNGREQINSALYGLLDIPEVTYARSQAAAAYRFWEVEKNTKAVMKSVYNYVIDIIEEEIESLKSVITDLEKTKITVFDPMNGEVQTDTYLIVPMRSLKSLPGIDIAQHYNTIRSYMPDTSEWGSVSDYVPSSDVNTWMPPFDAFATVKGNIFTTFDGKTYQFNGRCSYILAGDYMDGNFSIILDNMSKTKRRVIVTTTQHGVQLLPKNKLRVDGAIVEMPYHAQDISVINDGDDVTVTGRGFTVRHNAPSDSYEIGLSGWYYGKTGGLLGTYDNERHNDMMMSSRRLASDINSFADTWEVKDRCR